MRESVNVPDVTGFPGKARLIEVEVTEPVSGTVRPPSGSTNDPVKEPPEIEPVTTTVNVCGCSGMQRVPSAKTALLRVIEAVTLEPLCVNPALAFPFDVNVWPLSQ